MQISGLDLSYFPSPPQIRASIEAGLRRDALVLSMLQAEKAAGTGAGAPQAAPLDNVGTTRSFGQILRKKRFRSDDPARFGPKGQTGARPAAGSTDWSKEHRRRKKITQQITHINKELSTRTGHGSGHLLNRAAATLNNCGKNWLVEKKAPGKYEAIHSFHCKKKYCPRCAEQKRNVLLSKFVAFFEEEQTETARQIMSNYDLCLMTVTLRHGSHTQRHGWYFNELKQHWANALKYGAFRKYIHGGVYTTEITYSDRNGFHIHRHAIALVPKEYGMRDGQCGAWQDIEGEGWRWTWKDATVPQALAAAWLKRTGDSFQVDIKPVNRNGDFIKNLLEIFKYVAKPSKNEDGIKTIEPKIIEELERNSRQKFVNRYGILYKVKELALNDKPEKKEGEGKERNPDNIYFASGLYRTKKKKWAFQTLFKFSAFGNSKELMDAFAMFCRRDRFKILCNLENNSFRRENDTDALLSQRL